VFLDDRPDEDDAQSQIDMKDCPVWALTFRSRVQARGNLRTFRRIRKQVKISEERMYNTGSRLLQDAFEVNNTDQDCEGVGQ